MPTESSQPDEIRDGRDLPDRPGPETREAFVAWWLADLAERHPGLRFRLVDKQSEERS